MTARTKRLLALSPLLILVPAALLAAGWLELPWWLGLCCIVFLAGLAGAVFFMRSLMLRRFEASYVRRELEQEEEPQAQETGAAHLRALEKEWQHGVETLLKSHLKKLGDPLHVLPWYLVLGGSGSGKSSALKSAGLSSTAFGVADSDEDAPTESCRWWFFDKSVLLDTPGRYAVPHDEEKDREEWQRFLTLLAKCRRREPLNGVILTVAADTLLNAAQETLKEEAATLRRRVDELMRVFRVRFPVYLLVTKADLIPGMGSFSALLSEEVLSRPMGMLNEAMSQDSRTFAEKALAAILEQLRLFRLQLLNLPQARRDAASFALLPEEFTFLHEPLTTFIAAAFHENPYQETPALRGIFFGSGRQGDGALQQLSDAAEPMAQRRQTGAERALFLREFFAAVLPRDRSLLAPTKRAAEWRSATAAVGVVSWVLVLSALCGLLGFSFVKNLRIIREASAQVATPVKGSGALSEAESLDALRGAILRVEAQNGKWRLPRLGLDESVTVERGLKERYCRRFHKEILSSLDRDLEQSARLLSCDTVDEPYAHYAVHLIRRLNLLKSRSAGATLAQLQGKPLPPPLFTPETLQPHGAEKVGRLYLCYLAWNTDMKQLQSETNLLQERLRQAVAQRRGDLRWLARWVDAHEGVEPITVARFWGGIPAGGAEPVLRPCFTRRGRERLLGLVSDLESAAGPGQLDRSKAELEKWQRSSAFEAWRVFARDFPCGAKRLRGNSECQRICSVVGSGAGPYFALLDRLTWELEPLSHDQGVPGWLQQLYLLQAARAEAAGKEGGAVAKAAENGAKVLTGLKRKLGGAECASLEAQQAMATAWRDYLAALSAITPAVASRAQSFQLASQTFSDDPATGRSPFFAAYHAITRLRSGFGRQGSADFPWQVVTGPMEFLWWYVRKEATAQLQEQWEEQVVPGSAELPPPQAAQVLLGPDGLAWRFAKGPAAPFLVRTENGFRPKVVLGSSLPLDGAFYSFMRSGTHVVASTLAKQASYTVGIRALPTEANADARTQPHATRLELMCTGKSQSIVNLNYPSGKTLYWAPDSCGDVLLEVEVGDLVLTKRYVGPQAFPAFLRDFRGGSRTLSTRDFPGEKSALDRMGVKEIRVNYQFTGSAAVIRQASVGAQAVVPRSIGHSY